MKIGKWIEGTYNTVSRKYDKISQRSASQSLTSIDSLEISRPSKVRTEEENIKEPHFTAVGLITINSRPYKADIEFRYKHDLKRWQIIVSFNMNGQKRTLVLQSDFVLEDESIRIEGDDSSYIVLEKTY